jgi:two-component system, NarL family, nitrate/nitrite response regulator NarL
MPYELPSSSRVWPVAASPDLPARDSSTPVKIPQSSEPGKHKAVPRLANRQRRRSIHTVIVDPDPLICAGLRYMLSDTQFRVTSSCSNLDHLSKCVINSSPELLLVGIGENASEVLSQVSSLKKHYDRIHIVVLANEFCFNELLASTEAGADGYLAKNQVSGDAIVKAIELSFLGLMALPRGFKQQIRERAGNRPDDKMGPQLVAVSAQCAPRTLESCSPTGLSNREQLIAGYLARGSSNKIIARELNIAEATVKAHVKALLRKIGAANRTQAAVWAMGGLRERAPQQQI